MSLIRQQVASAIDYGALPDRRVMRTHFQKRRFTSFGVMAYCLSTRQWLLVRPSHSYSYTLFVNGMYRKADLEVMLSLMTIDELTILRKLLHGQKEWRDVYHGHFFKETFDLFKHSQSKLRICLSRVAGHPKTAWTFPKGRPENDESVMETAVREFDEETGLHIERIGRLIDRTPIPETYTSFDHQILRDGVLAVRHRHAAGRHGAERGRRWRDLRTVLGEHGDGQGNPDAEQVCHDPGSARASHPAFRHSVAAAACTAI